MKVTVIIAALLVISSGCYAQQSRLLGRWAMDPTRSESAGEPGSAVDTQLVIAQTQSSLTIQTRQGGAERTVAYNIDGSDTLSQLGSDSATGHMKWEGDQLVTNTDYNVKGTALGQTATYSPSSDGREMTVEYKLRVLHGYEGNHPDIEKKDPNYSTGKDVFIRR